MSTVITRQSPLNYQKRYRIDDGVPRSRLPVQIGVRVANSTVNGDYARGSVGFNAGKQVWSIIGDDQGDQSYRSITWFTNLFNDAALTPHSAGFVIFDNGNSPTYYSLSNVTTPDLAANWKNGGDDSNAVISVTSILI